MVKLFKLISIFCGKIQMNSTLNILYTFYILSFPAVWQIVKKRFNVES